MTNLQKENIEESYNNLLEDYNKSMERHKSELEEESNKRRELHLQFESSIESISSRLENEKIQRETQSQVGQALHDKVVNILNDYTAKEKQYLLKIEKNQVEIELANTKYQHQLIINTELNSNVDLYFI